MSTLMMGAFLMSMLEDVFWIYDEDQCHWIRQLFQGRFLKKGGKSKGKGKKGNAKGGKGSASRRFF